MWYVLYFIFDVLSVFLFFLRILTHTNRSGNGTMHSLKVMEIYIHVNGWLPIFLHSCKMCVLTNDTNNELEEKKNGLHAHHRQ